MDELLLDLFYEEAEDEPCAQRLALGLQEAVAQLAPHVALEVFVRPAEHVEAWTVQVPDGEFAAVQHAPIDARHQSLLLTRVGLVHSGYGTAGKCVVSLGAVDTKESNGGDPVDIIIHEWIHTLHGQVLNGRTVPFVDDAEQYGYEGVSGGDGEPRWEAWYRRCLGGAGDPKA